MTRGADLLTGRDRVNGDRYQVDTVGGRGGFAERGERGGVFGVAGLSGGSWLLQGRLAAIGCCRAVQGRCTRPSFNGAAALKCFFLSSSFLFSSCLVLNKNKNDTELQFSNCILIRWCC